MTGITSPGVAVKSEEDLVYNSFGNTNFGMADAFGSSWHANGNAGHVDPSQLHSMGQNGMSGSFIQGNSTITDDDLLGSFGSAGQFQTGEDHHNQFGGNMQHMATSQQNLNHMYSSTPDGAPIRSPFTSNNFDYAGWNSMRAQTQMRGPLPTNTSLRSPQSQQHNGSLSRSPMTPMTPNMVNVNVGTPDMGVNTQQGLPAAHRRSVSQQWDNSVDSGYSYMASPLASPSNAQHPQISEVLRSGSNAGVHSQAGTASRVRSIEDKKAKRRASHNEVERKRRNNINNQITTLSRLVPPHRLEDDNIRRAIQTNQTLPAHISGVSGSPQNGSLMSPSLPRRGVGSITQGLPIDEKDKAPAKGDVLNSSVGWMRDLLWLTQHLLNRESIYQETIENLGGQLPVQITEDENRMRTEVLEAMSRNNVEAFEYSRKHGSGLWVPSHTDPQGRPLKSMSPEEQQAALGDQMQSHRYWGYDGDSGHNEMELKEEDEYGINMDME